MRPQPKKDSQKPRKRAGSGRKCCQSATNARPYAKIRELMEEPIFDRIRPDKIPPPQKSICHYLNKITRLGGYLARAHDPPPGNIIMWRGWQRLNDIAIGASLGKAFVGN